MIYLIWACAAGGCYLLGRMQGYEASEKHYEESKAFWKEVKKHGL